ncbi:MAG TPA: ATPase, T2SS/T4P/T4SS family, partial [Candidatus Hydrogenedentes bacterium]|nr:ATPase, T2SS/T4P/T4SS family [Candidatus Hydrogenedentota bacterium]
MSMDNIEAGDRLVKQDLITQEELAEARDRATRSGIPWYKQLIQSGKVSFSVLEDALRYEFHLPSTQSKQKQLGDTLVEIKAITLEQLREALAEQQRTGRLLGNILLEHEYVTEEMMARALSRQQGLEFTAIEDASSSRDALEAVPESIARSYQFIPVAIERDKVAVLIADPSLRERLGDAGVLLSKRFYPMMTAAHDLEAEIERRYAALRQGDAPKAAPRQQTAPAKQATKAGKAGERAKGTHAMQEPSTTKTAAEPSRFEEIAKKASGSTVIKLVSTILEGAVNSGATDVHLDPQEPEMRVRYRIDGVLHDIMSIPQNTELAVISRIKILADLDITETRHPQDGHISMEVAGRAFDVRVATLPTFLGERVVLRLLDQTSILSGIKDLGLESDDEKKLTGLINQP